MPDMSLPPPPALKPVSHPGSTFPDVRFRVQRVKVTLVATLELESDSDIRPAKDHVEKALSALTVYAADRVSVSYEKL
jgi:hypothetical protein